MNPEQQKTIQKICRLMEHKAVLRGYCICRIMDVNFTYLSQISKDYLLLGFLSSKPVLITVYGEEDLFVCNYCGFFSGLKDYTKHDTESPACMILINRKAEVMEGIEKKIVPAWQYRHSQSGYSVQEKLEYLVSHALQ